LQAIARSLNLDHDRRFLLDRLSFGRFAAGAILSRPNAARNSPLARSNT
jgi:hypothetical protein